VADQSQGWELAPNPILQKSRSKVIKWGGKKGKKRGKIKKEKGVFNSHIMIDVAFITS